MKREGHITVTVIDWPAFGRTTVLSLSREICPTPEALASWARGRYGPGELKRLPANGVDEQWEYRRELSRGHGLLKLLARVLHRSFD